MQTENKREFSLAGIYAALRCANLSVEMISYLLLINRNIAALGRNTPIAVFQGSLYYVADIFDETKRNPNAFADARDTE